MATELFRSSTRKANNDVKAIVTHSIHSAIHSIGGIQVLFPLFSQLDYRQLNDSSVDTTVCATLLAFLVELLKSSVAMQEQMLGGKGFLVIGYLLEKMEAFSRGEDSRQSWASVALALYVKEMELASLPSYSTCLWCSARWMSLSDLNLKNGFTLNTWFRQDPLNNINVDKDKPYLYCPPRRRRQGLARRHGAQHQVPGTEDVT
ncbi:hypothetical protein CRUP_012289 [Coryphaenoides rupestris]|nr:hypothetical protein CRUP_012289 [Coryphaenoides rupestris]